MVPLHSGPSDRPSLIDTEQVFGALAHESRRQILILLGQRGGELPSGYLASRLPHSWPTTSRHLKVLEDAGLVDVRREGRGSNYRLNRPHLVGIVTGWLGYMAEVDPEQRWTSSGPKSIEGLAERDAGSSPSSGRDHVQQSNATQKESQ